ncbi:hypothetical protein MNBD_ACTINO02-477, partial [hydrothermal vent metagenome]
MSDRPTNVTLLDGGMGTTLKD